jgi:hypothetical protein
MELVTMDTWYGQREGVEGRERKTRMRKSRRRRRGEEGREEPWSVASDTCVPDRGAGVPLTWPEMLQGRALPKAGSSSPRGDEHPCARSFACM